MTCYPCIIMTVAGTEVKATLVYTSTQICATELFSVSLTRPQIDYHTLRQYVPAFQTLRETARKLREWYANVHVGSSLPLAPFLFPQPSTVIPYQLSLSLSPSLVPHSIDISTVKLIEKVGPPENTERCLYKGVIVREYDRPILVYIKFVPITYGVRPHLLLASKGKAPQLYYCADVVSGLKVVVMEDLGGYALPAICPSAMTSFVEAQIWPAIEFLHENNCVHGDLRPQNVVIDDAKSNAFLVDFDWAGSVGVARYPTRLNHDITWRKPLQELEDELIQKEDDIFMFKNMIRTVNKDTSAKRPRNAGDSQEGASVRKKSKAGSTGQARQRGDMPPPSAPASK